MDVKYGALLGAGRRARDPVFVAVSVTPRHPDGTRPPPGRRVWIWLRELPLKLPRCAKISRWPRARSVPGTGRTGPRVRAAARGRVEHPLGIRYGAVGRRQDALTAAEEAVALRRTQAEQAD